MDPAPRSFEPELLLRDTGWLHSLCRHLVHDAAEDVAQDTWLAAVGRVWPEGAPPRRWLSHVARNVARARVRADERRRAREIDARTERVECSPAELVARMETQRHLSEAVLALDEPYRTAILMRYVEGLEPAEIARRLGSPAATVRSRVKRGLALLREDLDRRSGSGDRRTWIRAFAPFLRDSHAGFGAAAGIGGIVAMKTLVWIAAAVLVVAGLFWWSRAVPELSGEKIASPAAAQGSVPVGEARTASAIDAPTAARSAVESGSGSVAQAHLVLRLLDASTHEPVPHLALTITGPDTVDPNTVSPKTVGPNTRDPNLDEALESDADGIVRSGRFGAGDPITLDFSPSTHPSDIVQVNREAAKAIATSIQLPAATDSSRAVREVEVEVGPTYSLVAALPGGLTAGSFIAQLSSADSHKAFDKLFAPLRVDGGVTWIRFSPKARAMSGGPPWKIHVRSDDGLWSGSCQVDTNSGTQRAPLPIVFESTGRVNGTMTDADGAPRKREYVRFVRKSPEGQTLLAFLTDANGRYDGRWIPPGPYNVNVESGRSNFEAPIEVRAGVTLPFDIALPRPPAPGSLHVRMSSETGSYVSNVRVTARSLGTSHELVSRSVAWDADGADRRGRAELDGIEKALQRLDLFAEDGTPVSPGTITVQADGRVVDAVVLDRTPMLELVFEVRDAVSDEAVTFETLRVSISGAADGAPKALVKKPDMRARLPVAPSYAVEMYARGYRPMRVDIQARADNAPIVLRARKGWGTQVHAVDDANQDLPLVRIQIDGHDAGRTDARGVLDVELDAEPATMKAELEGWKLSAKGDVDPATGSFRTWMPWVRLVLEREAR